MKRFLPSRLIIDSQQRGSKVNQSISQGKTTLVEKIKCDKKRIGICVIAPTEEAKSKLDKLNDAINTIANFTSPILNSGDSALFNSINAKENLSFWIQDEFLVLEEVTDPEEIKVKPIDDSIGRIEHVAFSYYGYGDASTENSYNKIYVDLVLKFARVFDNLAQIKPCLDQPKSSKNLILLEGKKEGNIPENLEKKFNNLKSNLENQDSINIKIDSSPFLLQGGNILFVGDFALVGYDSITKSYFKNLNKLFEYIDKGEEKELADLLKKEEDKFISSFQEKTDIPHSNIILVGSADILIESLKLERQFFKIGDQKEEYNWMPGDGDGRVSAQGIYHIDLFIAPAGKDEINNRDRLIIGDPIYNGDHLIPIFNYTKKVVNNLAKMLVGKGFSVYRNPLPLTYVDRLKEDKTSKRKWFFVSYNNCIIQHTNCPQERYVWMPVYGSDFSNEYLEDVNAQSNKVGTEVCGDWSYLKKYDEQSKNIWESLGFKVEKLTNYLPLAELKGGPRCLSKILHRKRESS